MKFTIMVVAILITMGCSNKLEDDFLLNGCNLMLQNDIIAKGAEDTIEVKNVVLLRGGIVAMTFGYKTSVLQDRVTFCTALDDGDTGIMHPNLATVIAAKG